MSTTSVWQMPKRVGQFEKQFGEFGKQYDAIYQREVSLHLNTDFGTLTDGRANEQYILNIVRGWLEEDLFMEAMKDQGMSVELIGADRNRVILPKVRVTGKADMYLNGELVEFMCTSAVGNIVYLKYHKVKDCSYIIHKSRRTGKYVLIKPTDLDYLWHNTKAEKIAQFGHKLFYAFEANESYSLSDFTNVINEEFQ